MEIRDLQNRQKLDLDTKILLTKQRIFEWYYYWHGQVYVGFSGGKDSTVLLDLVRREFPDVEAVFVDTGLEYPEIRDFIKTIPNVKWIRPKVDFRTVIDTYGYPVISKDVANKVYYARKGSGWAINAFDGLEPDGTKIENGFKERYKKYKYLIDIPFKISDKCCYKLKKEPVARYERETGKKAIIGTMADESTQRRIAYMRTGCNAFNSARPKSTPIAFWTEKDIWEYIYRYRIQYSTIYDKGYKRTGCMFCMFGLHCEKEPNKFQIMKTTHSQLYDYCINNLGCGKVLDAINIRY